MQTGHTHSQHVVQKCPRLLHMGAEVALMEVLLLAVQVTALPTTWKASGLGRHVTSVRKEQFKEMIRKLPKGADVIGDRVSTGTAVRVLVPGSRRVWYVANAQSFSTVRLAPQ